MTTSPKHFIAGLFVLVCLLGQILAVVYLVHDHHFVTMIPFLMTAWWALPVTRLFLCGGPHAYPWTVTAEKLPAPKRRVVGLVGRDAEVLHLDDTFPGGPHAWCRENGDVLTTPPSHWSDFEGNFPPLPTLSATR